MYLYFIVWVVIDLVVIDCDVEDGCCCGSGEVDLGVVIDVDVDVWRIVFLGVILIENIVGICFIGLVYICGCFIVFEYIIWFVGCVGGVGGS